MTLNEYLKSADSLEQVNALMNLIGWSRLPGYNFHYGRGGMEVGGVSIWVRHDNGLRGYVADYVLKGHATSGDRYPLEFLIS